ncbi:MAG TPA: hypothetical protein VFQ35_05415 [Polyangiaceae bacterium]|nr:hypothetical protein [Polyangiaceae bacterium]
MRVVRNPRLGIALLAAGLGCGSCGDVVGQTLLARGGGSGMAASSGGDSNSGGALAAGGTSTGGAFGGTSTSGASGGSTGGSIGGSTGGSIGGSSGSNSSSGGTGKGGGGSVSPCPTGLLGFASVVSGATGGVAGRRVRANTAEDLKAYAAADEPLVIEIAATIALSEELRPKPNKTFLGIGASGALTGAGFYIKNSENIVIQNLTISRLSPGDNDAIGIESSKYVWIDHCDLATSLDDPLGTYDGLVDITHASDFVTVSWSRLHDHYGVSVIGHSDINADEDTGHLRVTMHHNHFQNVVSATPRVRFGKVHLFNNYFESVRENAVLSQMGADVVLERNYFFGAPLPLVTHYTGPEDGNASSLDDVFDQSGAPMITSPSTWSPGAEYSYRDAWDSAGFVPTIVPACAGVGKTK